MKEVLKGKINYHWTHLKLVLRVVLKWRLANDFNWVFPLILVASAIGLEVLATKIMDLIGDSYLAIANADKKLFWATVQTFLLVNTGTSLIFTVTQYSSEACAAQWRERLTHVLQAAHNAHRRSGATAYSIGTGGDDFVDSPDQRITQDTDRFTTQLAALISDSAAIPFLITYYTYYLWSAFGWVAPAACLAYFVLGTTATMLFSWRIVPLVYRQEHLEGRFRAQHVRATAFADSISFLRGWDAEQSSTNVTFKDTMLNRWSLTNWHLPLYLVVNWFSYFGSVVNYAVVGVALLFLTDVAENGDPAELSRLYAQGNFACIYLISALTKAFICGEVLMDVMGLASRVGELLVGSDANASDTACELPLWGRSQDNYRSSSSDSGSCRSSSDSGCGDEEPMTWVQMVVHVPTAMAEAFQGVWFLYSWTLGACGLGYYAMGNAGTFDDHVASETRKSVSEGEYLLVGSSMCSGGNVTSDERGGSCGSDETGMHCRLPPVPNVNAPDLGEHLPLIRVHGLNLSRPSDLSLSFSSISSSCSSSSSSSTMAGASSCSSSSSSMGRGRDQQQQLLVRDLSFSVCSGQRLLLTGASGCGKTTLLRQLRQALTTSPTPELPGVIQCTVTPADVWFVPQTPYCFEGTLIANLCYPESPCTVTCHASTTPGHDIQADRQRARVALQTVRLDHLVPALEDEQVRSWDVILSPGERQRLEITRALLRRPRLLFLDEATALVDEATEALIYEALVGASEAMISVAHRGTVRCFHTRELHFSGDEDKGWTDVVLS